MAHLEHLSLAQAAVMLLAIAMTYMEETNMILCIWQHWFKVQQTGLAIAPSSKSSKAA